MWGELNTGVVVLSWMNCILSFGLVFRFISLMSIAWIPSLEWSEVTYRHWFFSLEMSVLMITYSEYMDTLSPLNISPYLFLPSLSFLISTESAVTSIVWEMWRMEDSLSSPLRVDLESLLIMLSNLVFLDILFKFWAECTIKCTRPMLSILYNTNIYVYIARCCCRLCYDSSWYSAGGLRNLSQNWLQSWGLSHSDLACSFVQTQKDLLPYYSSGRVDLCVVKSVAIEKHELHNKDGSTGLQIAHAQLTFELDTAINNKAHYRWNWNASCFATIHQVRWNFEVCVCLLSTSYNSRAGIILEYEQSDGKVKSKSVDLLDLRPK